MRKVRAWVAACVTGVFFSAAWAAEEGIQAAAKSPPAAKAGGAAGTRPKAGKSLGEAWLREPVVTVNGMPVPRAAVVDIVMSLHGRQGLEEAILGEAVRQEARKRGVTSTHEERATRLQDEVEGQMTVLAARSGLPDVAALEKQLERAGRSAADVRKRIAERARPFIEIQVLAAKMIRQDSRVTEAEVRKEYRRLYGTRARVRQIVLQSKAAAEDVLGKVRSGADFARLAKEVSMDKVSRSKGGEIVLFAEDRTLERTAFQMKPGQVSDVIETPDGFHILKFIEMVPPKRKVRFEKVRGELYEALMKRRVFEKRRVWLMDLMSKAKIERHF